MENWQAEQKVLNDDTLMLNPGRVLDNNNAHEMVQAINKAQDDGYKYIIVDLAQLEFLSSAGVGSILGTIEASREVGGDIILCNLRPTILHVLEVLDLTDYLTVRNNTEEAVSACGAEA